MAALTANPVFADREDIWTSLAELRVLDRSGPAWAEILGEAQQTCGVPDLFNQNSNINVCVLAKALVYAKLIADDPIDPNAGPYRADVEDALVGVRDPNNWCADFTCPGCDQGGPPNTCKRRTLALSRELGAYVVAADLIDYSVSDPNFGSWLANIRNEVFDGRTLITTHEERPNNWGTMACATRVAIARYLKDTEDLELAAQIAEGWMGNTARYAAAEVWPAQDPNEVVGPGFVYSSDASWQVDPNAPATWVGINPLGATKPLPGGGSLSIDGVIPDDQNEIGVFPGDPGMQCPSPCKTDEHVYEALQGQLACNIMLDRAGLIEPNRPSLWEWEDQAIYRAVQWATEVGDGEFDGDDRWLPWIVRFFYEPSYPVPSGFQAGKNFGYTEWTLGTHPCPGEDPDFDGVCNDEDNCRLIHNPKVNKLSFQTTTGGQLDDDADGWGNQCDGDFNNAAQTVDSADLALFKVAFGHNRKNSDCDPGGTTACDKYDLNGVAAAIDSADQAIFKTLFGRTKKQDEDLVETCCAAPNQLECDGDACD
jgi:hypothetical protein